MSSQLARHSWVAPVYYYLAALIGLIVVVVGALLAVNALMDAIFFEEANGPALEGFQGFEEVGGFNEDRGDKLEGVLRGLMTAAVGASVVWWHLQRARRREQV